MVNVVMSPAVAVKKELLQPSSAAVANHGSPAAHADPLASFANRLGKLATAKLRPRIALNLVSTPTPLRNLDSPLLVFGVVGVMLGGN